MKNEDNALFIVNKFAGGRIHKNIDLEIVNSCRARGWKCEVQFTSGPMHATELARKAVGNCKLIVAVGGDGTVNEVAQGLLGSTATMAIIPTGSGNGLARHLRIPLRLKTALAHLFNMDEVRIDTFRLNGRLSLNVSGIGFDGRVAGLFAGGHRRGIPAYAYHATSAYNSFREFEARITHARGEQTHRAFIIAIANSSQYGGNARIAPAASVCDGQLHISILKKFPLFRADVILDIFRGKIDRSSYCTSVETDRLEVYLKEPQPYHVDGEYAGENAEFVAELLPASLTMLVPHAHQPRPVL